MDKQIKSGLYDILSAIREIEGYFTEEGQKQFAHYAKDVKTKRAVERDLEIIGEAANRILQANPDFSLSDARKIIDMRNRIIHGYDTVSDEIVWGVLIKHLPLLKQQVEGMLQEKR
ncbi:MAG: HepT-like ribonuclease domain-containing protein [Fibrobacterota bacterium]